MQTVTLERPPTSTQDGDFPAPPRPRATWTVTLDWERLLYGLLIVTALTMRLWDLGARALHHDESLHALYSWYLYTGRGYQHDPMMHGPFQFHASALMYFLFGASDATARLTAALCGTGMVAAPYLLRSQLGRVGALVAATMIAFSPSMLYYSRFTREDTYVLLFTMLLCIALWRYVQDQRIRWVVLGAAATSLGFATKETTYMTVAIFGAYLVLITAQEMLGTLRRGFDLSNISPTAGFMILLGALALPQASAGALLVAKAVGMPLEGGGRELLQVVSIGGLMIVAAVLSLRWNPKAALVGAVVFYGIYILLFTTFFTNLPGFVSGIWGSLEYWLAQQEVRRGGQPWHYYITLIPLYDFLPLLTVLTAVVVKLRRRPLDLALAVAATMAVMADFAQREGGGATALIGLNNLPSTVGMAGVTGVAALLLGALLWRMRRELPTFEGFCWFWLAGALIAYSYAGEKMPWLSVHIVLPMILLAARSLGGYFERFDWGASWREGSVALIPVLALTPIAVGVLLSRSNLLGGGFVGQAVALLVIVGLLLYLLQDLARRSAPSRVIGMGAVAAVILLTAFTVRTGWQASYNHSDTPVEMLIYTQSSPDVPKVMHDIEELGRASGLGKELPITVDATDGFTWPWAWYLRDYKRVDFPTLSGGGTPSGTVLLLNATNERIMGPQLTKYSAGRRYPHRWWHPEDGYRTQTLGGLLRGIADPATRLIWWKYFMYRELPVSLGSSDAIAYYPKDLAPAANLTPGAVSAPDEYVSRQQAIRGAQIIGGRGSGPGAFEAPKGVALDAAGNIYVADSLNSRVQKLDPTGKVPGRRRRRVQGTVGRGG
ncbi:MAG: TIGR03663 family protein [Chloroflexi bacterium]|nr:TIGR03663 family protein [Chloroflexota bacterium]